MIQTIEYQKGIYTGELKNDLPDGEGTLNIDHHETYCGHWKEGKRHGYGYYSYVSNDDLDGLDCRTIIRKAGIWKDDILSGIVWNFRYEDELNESVSEECVWKDEFGLTLLGVNREGKLIGILADELMNLALRYNREMYSRNGNQCWGKVFRDGHTLIGQFSSHVKQPFYADDYLPHGFCIDIENNQVVYCGMYEMGQRKGLGVTWVNEEVEMDKHKMKFEEH